MEPERQGIVLIDFQLTEHCPAGFRSHIARSVAGGRPPVELRINRHLEVQPGTSNHGGYRERVEGYSWLMVIIFNKAEILFNLAYLIYMLTGFLND